MFKRMCGSTLICYLCKWYASLSVGGCRKPDGEKAQRANRPKEG